MPIRGIKGVVTGIGKNPSKQIGKLAKKLVNASTRESQEGISKYVEAHSLVSSRDSFSSHKKGLNQFQIGLSPSELKMRTRSDKLTPRMLMEIGAPEYENLAQGDKDAIVHLLNVGEHIDTMFKKMDNNSNLPFENFLKEKAAKGSQMAKDALKLEDAQNGIFANDFAGNVVGLKKGAKKPLGCAYYPENLKPKEFQNILINMLENGEIEEVKQILSARTIVERDGNKLKAIDFTVKYKKECQAAAAEMDNAAKVSTNEEYNKYLRLQAEAFRTTDIMADARADVQLATLQDTPLEGSLTKETYEDMFTSYALKNEKLKNLLEKHGITPIGKNQFGWRVGVVDKAGTTSLLDIKKYLPVIEKNMPHNSEYVSNLAAKEGEEVKQAIVQVKIIKFFGDLKAFRASGVSAENLPNDTEPAITILKGGKRNIFHEHAMKVDPKRAKERNEAILNPAKHEYYTSKGRQEETSGHENGHSAGPKREGSHLGEFEMIVEENKADMVSIGMQDVLKNAGKYSDQEQKEIITVFVSDLFKKAKPKMDQAHRVREVMQINFLLKEKAISIDKNGIVDIDFEKIVPATQKMLDKIVRVQIEDKAAVAEQYVREYNVWSKPIQSVAKNIKRYDTALNGKYESPLADKIMAEQAKNS